MHILISHLVNVHVRLRNTNSSRSYRYTRSDALEQETPERFHPKVFSSRRIQKGNTSKASSCAHSEGMSDKLKRKPWMQFRAERSVSWLLWRFDKRPVLPALPVLDERVANTFSGTLWDVTIQYVSCFTSLTKSSASINWPRYCDIWCKLFSSPKSHQELFLNYCKLRIFQLKIITFLKFNRIDELCN